jgi:hypothetical protein
MYFASHVIHHPSHATSILQIVLDSLQCCIATSLDIQQQQRVLWHRRQLHEQVSISCRPIVSSLLMYVEFDV